MTRVSGDGGRIGHDNTRLEEGEVGRDPPITPQDVDRTVAGAR
jgi:hypothetical protein